MTNKQIKVTEVVAFAIYAAQLELKNIYIIKKGHTKN